MNSWFAWWDFSVTVKLLGLFCTFFSLLHILFFESCHTLLPIPVHPHIRASTGTHAFSGTVWCFDVSNNLHVCYRLLILNPWYILYVEISFSVCLVASKSVCSWTYRFQYRWRINSLKIGSPLKLLLAYNKLLVSFWSCVDQVSQLLPTSRIKLTLAEGGWLQPEPSVYPGLA